jgi:multidrug efflux pump subunit AcrB
MSTTAWSRRRPAAIPFIRFQIAFEHYFEKLRNWYHGVLNFCLQYRGVFLLSIRCLLGWCRSLCSIRGSGRISSLRWMAASSSCMCARTPERALKTRRGSATRSKNVIRGEIPKAELGTIIDNIGIPYSGLNLSYSNSAPVGTARRGHSGLAGGKASAHRRVHARAARQTDPQFPGTEFYYLPTDMVSQILNFGLPAQIDVQVVGLQVEQNHALAEQHDAADQPDPGTTDLRIQQPFNLPKWTVNVDRTRAQEVGYSQRDVAQDLLTSLSGSFQTSPTFYLNPQNHVSYNIAVQTPQYDVQNLQQLENFPIATTVRASSRRFSATSRPSIAGPNRAR